MEERDKVGVSLKIMEIFSQDIARRKLADIHLMAAYLALNGALAFWPNVLGGSTQQAVIRAELAIFCIAFSAGVFLILQRGGDRHNQIGADLRSINKALGLYDPKGGYLDEAPPSCLKIATNTMTGTICTTR